MDIGKASENLANANFFEHLSTIQSIIDSWAALLDPKKSRYRLPNPSNYLSIIVLGDEQAGKTSFIQNLLGIQLGYQYMDEETMMYSQAERQNTTPMKLNGDEYALSGLQDAFCQQSGIVNKQPDMAATIDFPHRARSCYSSVTTPPRSNTALYPANSTYYSSIYYSDANRLSSPRSSQSVVSHGRRRPSIIQNIKKKYQPSCLPLVVSLRRGPESCAVTIPIRGCLLQSILPSDVMIKLSARFAVDTVKKRAPEISEPSTLVVDATLFIHNLEKVFRKYPDFSQVLSSLRSAADQEDIIELHYKPFANRASPTSTNQLYNKADLTGTTVHGHGTGVRSWSLSPGELEEKLYGSTVDTLDPDIDMHFGSIKEDYETDARKPGDYSVGARRVPPLARSHFVGRSSVTLLQSANKNESELGHIKFFLGSARFLPYYIALGRCLEMFARQKDSMTQIDELKSTFNKDEAIFLDFVGPNLPNFRIIEVPGAPTQDSTPIPADGRQEKDPEMWQIVLRERAKHTLRSYAVEPTALFVNVIDANHAMAMHESKAAKNRVKMPDSLRWIVELEPQGTRTMIVLSKVDQVSDVGQFVTIIYGEKLPWAKDYERRAAAMFYKRYLSQLQVTDQNTQTKSAQLRSHSKSGKTNEPIKSSPKRISFKSLGLHYPKVVGLSLICQARSTEYNINSDYALDIMDIPQSVGAIHNSILRNEQDVLAKFSSIMTNYYDSYFGFKCLVQHLITTVCMTIGAQCIEPAAIVLTREMRKLEKKVELEINRVKTVTPEEKFEKSMKKLHQNIESIFTSDEAVLLEWANNNQITDGKKLEEHFLAATAPVHTVLSSICSETEHRLWKLDDNQILNEYYKKIATSVLGDDGKQAQNKTTLHKSILPMSQNNEEFAKEKLRIIIDYIRNEFEKTLKRAGSYLKTCLQSMIRSSFDSEYTEDQFLAAKAIITGLYHKKLMSIRKEIRTKCEQFYFTMLNQLSTVKIPEAQNDLYNNLMRLFQSHWHTFFSSTFNAIMSLFLNCKNALVVKEGDESSEIPATEWLNSLKRVFLSETITNKNPNQRVDQILVQLSLFRRVLEQLDIYIQYYPLLYHFCSASVTHSQVDHKVIASKTKGLLAMKNDKKFAEALIDEEILKDSLDKNERAGLINAKTLSYICSGSIGAALLYSLTKKQ